MPKGGGPLEEIKAELDDDRLKEAVFAEGRKITIWYRIAEVRHVSSNCCCSMSLDPHLLSP